MATEADGAAPIIAEANIVPMVTSTTTKVTKAPQQAIDDFWGTFTSKKRGKALTVLPDNYLAKKAAENNPKGKITGKSATANYESAAAKCREKVAKIAKECKRVNQKYRDAHFDLEDRKICLMGLTDTNASFVPQSIMRVGVCRNRVQW